MLKVRFEYNRVQSWGSPDSNYIFIIVQEKQWIRWGPLSWLWTCKLSHFNATTDLPKNVHVFCWIGPIQMVQGLPTISFIELFVHYNEDFVPGFQLQQSEKPVQVDQIFNPQQQQNTEWQVYLATEPSHYALGTSKCPGPCKARTPRFPSLAVPAFLSTSLNLQLILKATVYLFTFSGR